VGMNPEQLKKFKAFVKRREHSRNAYYFKSLPLRLQLKILYKRGAFNPYKVVRWVVRRKVLKIPVEATPPLRARTQP
jgi:hypothetical protein